MWAGGTRGKKERGYHNVKRCRYKMHCVCGLGGSGDVQGGGRGVGIVCRVGGLGHYTVNE